MEKENLSFPEAIKFIADYYRLEIKREKTFSEEEKAEYKKAMDRKKLMLHVNSLTADFYFNPVDNGIKTTGLRDCDQVDISGRPLKVSTIRGL